MLKSIVRFSLRFRGVVIALSVLLLGYGFYSLSRAKYDVFPEFAPPQVDIQTEAPGLAPEQVEVLVTQPIENAINGLAGIEALRSASIQGLSLITVVFSSETNIYLDRQMLTEHLSSISGQLPSGVGAPVITPLTSSTGDLMTLGVTSEKHSLMELRTLVDWTIRPHLLSVPGVAKVSIFGGEVKQFQIQVQPERLIQYNLGIEDVLAAARRATGVRGAGFLDTENQRIVLKSEGQSLSAEELGKTMVVRPNSAAIPLGEVAKVTEAPEPRISAATVMGKPAVVLNLWIQYGANTLEVSRRVEKAIEELRPTLDAQGVFLYSDIFKAANFIQTALHNIQTSLIIGAILVMLVLFLFLFNFRTAAISCAAIPLSLLAAIAVLDHMGESLNTMTLGGLAISIGLLVDDAVIMVENIYRRMRENRHHKHPRDPFRVVLDAALEVRSAVVYATIAVALVFIPVLTMSGVAGRLFAPLGIAYILATLASLLVALTVTPALCFALLGGGHFPEKESPVVVWLKERYRSLLLQVERYPRSVICGVALFAIACLSLLFFLGGEFLPELREGHFIVHMTALAGTSLDESQRIGNQVTQELLKIPYVRLVEQQIGRAASDDVYGTNTSEIHVELKPLRGKQAEHAQEEIRKTLETIPGANFTVKTLLTERIDETLSGYTSSVVLNIFGNDLDTLDKTAQEVATVLGKVPGAIDVQVQSPPGTPQFVVRLKKEALTHWGFDPLDVLEDIRTAYQGEVVGQVYDGNRFFDVTVNLAPTALKTISEVGAFPLRSPTGNYVPLQQLADIEFAAGRYVVLHEGARRVQTITCNVAHRDLYSFVADAKKQILSTVKLPAGTYLDFSGAAEAQARSKQDLLIHSLMAGLGVILLLSIVIGNSRNLILVLVNLPFALVGGVLAVFVSREGLSIGSMVGFVTLFGITLRNSIMMISHYSHLVHHEGLTWGTEAAVRGATERLSPILMTALVTALGLLPLALGTGDPGREIEGPMAIVILGGLVTSTALNLLVLPTLALRYGRFDAKIKSP